MINGQAVLAVILARGGSKRVPGKNIKPFRGKPLIAWTMEQASKSQYIDWTIISTDSDEIKDVCLALGGEVNMRPAELATDTATSEDALRHTMNCRRNAEWIVLLQPTSPLRTTEDIDACIERAQWGNGCISTHMGKTNGAVYVATSEWLKDHNFSHMGLLKHEMPEERSLDLDTEAQFAEFSGDSAS